MDTSANVSTRIYGGLSCGTITALLLLLYSTKLPSPHSMRRLPRQVWHRFQLISFLPIQFLLLIFQFKESCRAEHVLGVYRIINLFDIHTPLDQGGLMYDIIIFGVVHLQQEIFHTKAFNSLVSAIQREKDSEILAIERRDKVHREQQVSSALKARNHLKL